MIKLIRITAAALLLLTWAGCRPDKQEDPKLPNATEIDDKLANDWVALTLDLTKSTTGFSPPVAARAYAYTSLTLYESIVHGMSGYQSMHGHLNGLPLGALPDPNPSLSYHWGLCANRALAYITSKLYKTASADNLARIGNLENQYEQSYSKDLSLDIVDRSKAYGEAVAKAIYEYSKTDGQDEGYNNNYPAGYKPPTFAGAWVPTPPAFQAIPLQPYWGNVRSFIAADADATQPQAPLAYSTTPNSPFYVQALEVYSVSANLNNEQIKIAQYWSDDPGKTATPAGHSMSIARLVLDKEKASLARAAEVYTKIGIGVHDAFVSCWKAKYTYNLIRPVSYIRANIDPTYSTLLPTPPFPEYTSGHSVQSGAAAQILSDLFGYNYAFVDRTNEGRTDIDGTARSFPTFMDFAQEAAISRLYGGIHYRAAIEEGIAQGIKVGRNVSGLEFKK